MSDSSALVPSEPPIEHLISLTLGGLSAHSKRSYRTALVAFFDWLDGRIFTKATVQEYRDLLVSRGLSASTINARLSAIRKLAQEAADNGLLPPETAQAVGRAPNVKQRGNRTGKWLTAKQCRSILSRINCNTLVGLRDKMIVSLAMGGALRRSEIASLTLEHFREIEGRWVIVDLLGKGNRLRTVPIPLWVWDAVRNWLKAAEITEGVLVYSLCKGGIKKHKKGLTCAAIYSILKSRTNIAPHDLRRTFARLAYQGHADLTQIQLSLGHSSVRTTQDYVAANQSFSDAPGDCLGIL